MADSWDSCPDEVIRLVVDRLPLHEWRPLSQVNKRTYSVIQSMKPLITEINTHDIDVIVGEPNDDAQEEIKIQNSFLQLVSDFKHVSKISCSRKQAKQIATRRVIKQLSKIVPNIKSLFDFSEDMFYDNYVNEFIGHVMSRDDKSDFDPCCDQTVRVEMGFSKYEHLTCQLFSLCRHVPVLIGTIPRFLDRLTSIFVDNRQDRKMNIILPNVKMVNIDTDEEMLDLDILKTITPNMNKLMITYYFSTTLIPFNDMMKMMINDFPKLDYLSITCFDSRDLNRLKFHLRRKSDKLLPITVKSGNHVKIADTQNLHIIVESRKKKMELNTANLTFVALSENHFKAHAITDDICV